MRRHCVTAAILLCCLTLAAAAAPESRDQQHVEALRKGRLYDQADAFCAERLADSRLSDEQRFALVIERSRTWADRALDAPLATQSALWEKAYDLLTEFARQQAGHPRLMLVRVQSALTASAQAQRAREEAELSGSQAGAMAAAQELARTTIVQLRKLEADCAALLKNARRERELAGGDLSEAERLSLQTNLRYELARSLRNQALCYPAQSADRINSLSQAVELLGALSQQELQPPLASSVRGDEIACRRLLGDFSTAERRLADWDKSPPTGSALADLRAERIRLSLARRRLDEALSEAGSPGAAGTFGGASFELARLEAYLGAWHRALEKRDARGTADWERAVANQADSIEQGGDPFSSRQAEAMFARALTGEDAPQNLDVLVRAAQAFYRSGQPDQAVATYDKAARRAREAHDAAGAFAHAYSAATIQRERQDYRDAIDRYRKLALLAPREPRAAEAHLLAVHCAAQLAQRDSQPKLAEYERLLREHVATWPQGPTAAQAWWWLGRLDEHDQIYADAIRAFRNVPADDPRYAAAVEASGRCYAGWLLQLRQANKPSTQQAADAVRYFEQIVGAAGSKPRELTEAQRAAALIAARLWLLEVPNGATHAEELLHQSLGSAVGAPPAWKTAAQSLEFLAVAAQGRTADAETLLARIPMGDTADALAMAATLGELSRRAGGHRKRGLAEMRLRVLDDLAAKRDDAKPEERTQISRQRAAAMADAGRRAEAIATLEALAVDNPRDGQTQEDLATLWTDSGDAAELGKAGSKWREITLKSRPGTPRWFRANYGLARTQLESGRAADARATIKRVESAYADYGGAELKFKFQELLGQCDRRGNSIDAQ
jgi:tetratricopeptide (TPR) repeat protein